MSAVCNGLCACGLENERSASGYIPILLANDV